MHSWSLSRQLWVVGRATPIPEVVTPDSWASIDQEMCDRFWHTYRSTLDSFDLFVVDHPVCLAACFEKFDRPVVAVATTRYELGLTRDPERWRWLNWTLQAMHDRGQLLPLSNNRGDREYAREHLGFDWPTVPSLCEYPGAQYSGEDPRWLRVRLGRPPLPQPYSWADLARCRGIYHVPYNCSQISICEQYAAGIPLVFPTRERLLDLARRDVFGAMAQVSLRRVEQLPPGEGLNDYTSRATLARWVDLCDWYDEDWMPGIVTVDAEPDRVDLDGVDWRRAAGVIAAARPVRRDRILRAWRDVFARLE